MNESDHYTIFLQPVSSVAPSQVIYYIPVSSHFGLESENEERAPTPQPQATICLICGQSAPAVVRSAEGNIVRREPLSPKYSFHDLFSNLCKGFKFKKSSKQQRQKEWKFGIDVFPFCEPCEKMMTELANLQTELAKLMKNIKQYMVTGEKEYVKRDLYEKFEQRYFNFRKQVLGGGVKCLGTKSRKRNTGNTIQQNNSENDSLGQVQPEPFPLHQPVEMNFQSEPVSMELAPPPTYPQMIFQSLPIAANMTYEIQELTDNTVALMDNANDHPLEAIADDMGVPVNRMEEDCNGPIISNNEDGEVTILMISDECGDSGKFNNSGNPNELYLINLPVSNDNYTSEVNGTVSTPNIYNGTVESSTEIPVSNHVKKKVPSRRNNRSRKSFTSKYPLKQVTLVEKILRRKRVVDLEKNPNLSNELHSVTIKYGKARHRGLDQMGHTLIVDTNTGNVTYETGLGHKKGTTRYIMEFEKLEGDQGYRCSACSEVIPRDTHQSRQNRLYRQHFMSCHRPPARRFKCFPCQRHFRSKEELATHSDTVHAVRKKRKASGKRDRLPNSVCEVCGKPFDESTITFVDYLHHRRSHWGDQDKEAVVKGHLSKCSKNLQKFGVDSSTDEIPDVNICQTCNKLIRGGENGMKLHLRSHKPTEEKFKFLCSECGERFSSRGRLGDHIKKLHENDSWAPNSCKFPSCGMNLGSGENLKVHIRKTHGKCEEGIKGLLCMQCGRPFTTSWALKMHTAVHTGERNFECHICFKRFPLKDTLLLHMAAIHHQGEHYGVFKCDVERCNEVFPCAKYLGNHMRSKHKILKRKKPDTKSEIIASPSSPNNVSSQQNEEFI